MYRTHNNGELRIEHVGQTVTLVGWVSKKRNLGSLVFIDLRDREGITQIICSEALENITKEIHNEYVLKITGKVVERSSKNPKMPTGDIEIEATNIEIVNSAKQPPMIVADKTDALEETRLKYRYVDLRRPVLQENLKVRHQVTQITRNYLSDRGFLEIETPILCKSTPEGARDYLVPSRISKGSFYALPQSPQIYKQLLMIGGMDKYFQIARCFRDEDLRADRQPEFTQIDIEMSFVDEEDVWGVVEGLMQEIFKKIKNVELAPFRRIAYTECMSKYGSDKPDLRFGMELNPVNHIFENTEFGVFKTILEANGLINMIVVKNAADKYSRKALDQLQDYAKIYGAKALSFLKYNNGAFAGSIAKVVSEEEKAALVKEFNVEENDMLLFIADKKATAQTALGAVRLKLGQDLGLIDESKYEFLWVTNFPMFEYSEEENRYMAAHHPFTSPNLEDVDKLLTDKANVYSRAYDLVLNGYELLSGSIRIHDQELQAKVFEAIGMSQEEAQARFGFFLDAFKYGTPPHGGVGIGLERLIMLLVGTNNIRDVVAFPKTASASDLMSEAPGSVDPKQLVELGIGVLSHE